MGNQIARESYEQGWHSAVQLADWLRGGGDLPTAASSIVLQPEETLICSVQAELAGFWSQDVAYSSDAMVFGATWKGLAATAAASMAWNSRQRKKAEREGALQWRSMGTSTISLTDHRLLFPADGQMITWWLGSDIVAFEPHWSEYAAMVHGNGSAPIMFRGPAVPYIAVLLNVLLHRVVPDLRAP